MYSREILLQLVRFLLPASIALTAYLYCYPLANGCAFPAPRDFGKDAGPETCILEENPFTKPKETASKPVTAVPEVAPFRLLALGDPQLEGDSSLPKLKFPSLHNFQEHVLAARFGEALNALKEGAKDTTRLVANSAIYARKKIDLLGNDYYLAHVYRALAQFTDPTHVTVLGDLLGSQWISDEEFASRSWRYWTRVFPNTKKVSPEKLGIDPNSNEPTETYTEILGADPAWRTRLIHVAGNHDIGYAGDLNHERVARFEREFGPVNGDLTFQLNSSSSGDDAPVLRILVLNSMNLDGPVLAGDLQQRTFAFVNSAMNRALPVESHRHATVLLTHIPLHKRAGICVDAPWHDYHADGRGVREQNMLSADVSRSAVLQGLFGKSPDANAAARGMGRDGIVLTGHDHHGCSVYHWADRASGTWRADGWFSTDARAARDDEDVPGLREVTVRSMMGEFGGNAALVSAWWDEAAERWRFEVDNCFLGVQHIWWAIHILDLVTLVLCLAFAIVSFMPDTPAAASSGEHKSLKGQVGPSKTEKRPGNAPLTKGAGSRSDSKRSIRRG